MPASFKVTQVPVEGGEFGEYEEHLDPDFGESAIGRVAPVDSGKQSETVLVLNAHVIQAVFSL